MDLRGIKGVIRPADIEIGMFFLKSDHDGGANLCLRVGQFNGEQASKTWDIVFDRPDRHGMYLLELHDAEPVALLPPISVRIDHTSLAGTPFTTNFSAPMIAIAGQDLFLRTPHSTRGTLTFNLAKGEVTPLPSNWVSFSRWSLVMDRGDTELSLYSNLTDGG